MKKKFIAIFLSTIFLLFFINTTVIAQNTINYLSLVNKNISIGTYTPSSLVKVNLWSGKTEYLDKTVASYLSSMFQAAKKSGLRLYLVSGYRSFTRQKSIWNSSIYSNGLAHTEKYVARPGKSEHQTGFSADITGASYKLLLEPFERTKEFKWLNDNAHKYGFILRYPKEKEDITGYGYEPWHYRYVGIEAANEIKSLNLVLEEYIDILNTRNKLEANIIASIKISELFPTQANINLAKTNLNCDIPFKLKSTYSSAIDLIQQKKMLEAEASYNTAILSKLEDDIIPSLKLFSDISLSLDENVSRWALDYIYKLENLSVNNNELI